MELTWTEVQEQRLNELSADREDLDLRFGDPRERDQRFQQLEKEQVKRNRRRLERLRLQDRQPALVRLEQQLTGVLTGAGFVRVVTPSFISRAMLERMSITPSHSLWESVFWLDSKRCLRPMLAPNLYNLLRDLLRLWDHPVRIFEIGSCFRKDSRGAGHLEEFTMLNWVEMGLSPEERVPRLRELTEWMMKAAEISTWRFQDESSAVYGETTDILCVNRDGGEMEAGSAAFGPHPLDAAWRIAVPWVGAGFGLERLLMLREQLPGVSHVGRSLTYLDGACLKI